MLVTRAKFGTALEDLGRFPRLIVDTETTGLKVYQQDRVCGVAVWGGEEEVRPMYFPIRHAEGEHEAEKNLTPDQYRSLIEALSAPGVIHTGWNYKFDLGMLQRDGMKEPHAAEDVMLAAHLMNENEPNFKLKETAARYIDPQAAAAERGLTEMLSDRGMTKGDISRLLAAEVEPYATQDVVLTERMRQVYVTALRDWKLLDLWQEVNEYMLATYRMERHGLALDIDLIHEYVKEAAEKESDLYNRICAAAGYSINPRSSKQLQAWLGLASTAEEVLEEIGEDHPEALLLRDYRKWAKVSNTYYLPWLEKLGEDGFLHPNFLLHGTISGRPSCNSPNLQAVPRKTEIYKVKDVIVARPGYRLTNMDYSQAEIRLFAHYSEDAILADIFERDGDTHGEVATALGIPRDAAKRINLGTQYGLGSAGLASKLKIPLSLATEYLDRYHRDHPGSRRLYYHMQRKAEDVRYIRMWTGRVRRYNCSKAEPHKALSNLIQGGVAEVMRYAITSIDRMAREGPLTGTRMLLQVHDSILFETPEERTEEYLPIIQGIMQNIGDFSVPLRVDVMTGNRWGKLEPWGVVHAETA